MTQFLEKLNEPQRETVDRLRLTLAGSSRTDVQVRKDGQNVWFEADWLRTALDILCGPHPELERRRQAILQSHVEPSEGATGPETARAVPSRS